MMNAVACIYLGAIIIALIVIIVYGVISSKDYYSDFQLKNKVTDADAPTSGGCKYFKIVNMK